MTTDDLALAFGYTRTMTGLPVIAFTVNAALNTDTLEGVVVILAELVDEQLPLSMSIEEAEMLAGALFRAADEARARGLTTDTE